jgi:hypothetical protein
MAVDFSAIAKWPNVPACYGWLSLDRRGQWRLRGDAVTHRGLIDFMNRQYTHDEAGNWFVQNGPQRVFVELAATPWIYRYEQGGFVTHTGTPAGTISALWLDDGGSVLIEGGPGIGLLDDRDLPAFLAACTLADGRAAGEGELLVLMAGDASVDVRHDGLRLQPLAAAKLAGRFGFEPRPRPPGEPDQSAR